MLHPENIGLLTGTVGERTQDTHDMGDSDCSTRAHCDGAYITFQLRALTLLRYHGVYVTPVLFDSRIFNCREY
jgi:hypothetical protein